MKKSSIIVIGLFLLLYVLPLGVRPIIIPDESRYAEIPREMICSGDWIVPHLNGLRYFEKPVLGYWLNAASMMLFGENAFAIRFPSAMAAGISALMIFFMVRRFTGGHSPGVFAAMVFLTCLEIYGIGTFSVLDNVFAVFVTAAMVLFFFAYVEDTPGKKTGLLILSGVSCGLAFLTKGFIGVAIPVMIIGPFMLWEHRWKDLLRVSWIPILAALLVSLPWAVMVHLREPDFWNYFFWNEHIRRFMAGNAQHSEPLWFFIPVIIGGALPWTVLFPSVISGLRATHFKIPFLRFAACWFLFPFLFFSFSHGKLETYILPCFPPLAIFIALGLHDYLEKGKKRSFNIGVLLLVLLIGALIFTLVASQVTDFPGFRAYRSSEYWKWIFGGIGLLTWATGLILTLRTADSRKKLLLFCIAPLLFMFSAHFIMPDQVVEHKAPGKFLMGQAEKIQPDTILISDRRLVRAVCWFYKRNDVFLLNSGGELTYGLGYNDSKHRLLDLDQLKKLLTKSHGKHTAVLITEAKRYAKYRSLLPQPAFESIGNRFVFAQF
jgi:4-amino-4-deoxy-L-arabinose transferase